MNFYFLYISINNELYNDLSDGEKREKIFLTILPLLFVLVEISRNVKNFLYNFMKSTKALLNLLKKLIMIFLLLAF